MPKPIPHKQKSGGVVWLVKYRADGKVVTDTFDDEKGAHAYCKLVERVGGAAAREVLARRRGGAGEAPTLNEWTTTYLDPDSGILTGIQPGTRHGYQRMSRSFLSMLGEYPVDSITRDDVGRWVQWVEQQESGSRPGERIAAKTVKNYHGLLSNILKAAVERKLAPFNPARGVRTTPGQSREGVFLTPQEFGKILEHVLPHYRPLVVFLVNTGCRWGEATALTWGDVNLGKHPPSASINKAWKKGVDGTPVLGTPKSKKGRRTVPLSEKVVAYLPPRGAPDDLVFPGVNGGRLWYGMFNTRIWKRAVERSGIGKRPNIHDLRHTYASWLIADGAPLNVVQAKMGHEMIDTTIRVYSHLSPHADAEVVGTLDRAMVGVPDPVAELTSAKT